MVPKCSICGTYGYVDDGESYTCYSACKIKKLKSERDRLREALRKYARWMNDACDALSTMMPDSPTWRDLADKADDLEATTRTLLDKKGGE